MHCLSCSLSSRAHTFWRRLFGITKLVFQLLEENTRRVSDRHFCPSLRLVFLCGLEGQRRRRISNFSSYGIYELYVWGGQRGVMFISTVEKPGGISRREVSEEERGGRVGLYGNWPACCNCSSGMGLWSELFNTATSLVLDNCLNDLHGAWGCVTSELIQGQSADLTESSLASTLPILCPNNSPSFTSFYWTNTSGGVTASVVATLETWGV